MSVIYEINKEYLPKMFSHIAECLNISVSNAILIANFFLFVLCFRFLFNFNANIYYYTTSKWKKKVNECNVKILYTNKLKTSTDNQYNLKETIKSLQKHQNINENNLA